VLCEARLLERVLLVEELAGGVVVLDDEAGAGESIVGGRNIKELETAFRLALVQVADFNFGRVPASHQQHEQQGCRHEVADQGGAPTMPPHVR
jgi:hypothetical protein